MVIFFFFFFEQWDRTVFSYKSEQNTKKEGHTTCFLFAAGLKENLFIKPANEINFRRSASLIKQQFCFLISFLWPLKRIKNPRQIFLLKFFYCKLMRMTFEQILTK